MGYRKLEHHHHHGNRTAQKTSTPARYIMENGTTFMLAVPCWYKEIHLPERAWHHCRAHHDHFGWPDPMRPDHSCQDHDFPVDGCHHHHHHDEIECHNPYKHIHHHHHHLIDMAKLFPIHLKKEGYGNPTVVFDKNYKGLTTKAYIDDAEDWVIRLFISAYLDEAVDEPVNTRFTVKVSRTDEAKNKIVDVASRGILRVLPAPLEV